LAVVGNSYFYHTQSDTVQNIEPGVAQHFAENILHITKTLSARPMREAARLPNQQLGVKRWELDPTKTSVLEGVKKFEKGMAGGRRPPVVFFSLFGRWFVRYSFDTARVVYVGISLATLAVIAFFEVCRPTRSAAEVNGAVEKARKGKKGSELTSDMLRAKSHPQLQPGRYMCAVSGRLAVRSSVDSLSQTPSLSSCEVWWIASLAGSRRRGGAYGCMRLRPFWVRLKV
jgi:hypothetical protein